MAAISGNTTTPTATSPVIITASDPHSPSRLTPGRPPKAHVSSQQHRALMSDAKRGLLCRFHQSGACRDGPRCQFSHSRAESVPIPDTCCWYHLHSHCMYGDNCRFVHSDPHTILAHHRQDTTTSELTPTPPPPPPPPAPVVAAPAPPGPPTGPVRQVPYRSSATTTTASLIQHESSRRQSSEDSGFADAEPTGAKFSTTSQCSAATTGAPKTYAQMALIGAPPTPTAPNPTNTTTTATTCPAIAKTTHTGAAATATPVTTNTTTSTTGPPPTTSSPQLCPYAQQSIDGQCPYPEGHCHYTHGLMCELCGHYCLHPTDAHQQARHRDECVREHEREMELSFAVQRSLDKTCGICMDVVIEKEPVTERRFGILEKCSHIFCLSCIRKWRQTKQFENRTIRACPECRVASDFVVPSKYWYDERSEKAGLIESYKRALSTKPCKYFRQGQGECPFAGACFYLHAGPDGRRIEMPPPRQHRRRQNQEGELETLRDMLLWNYLEVRDDNHWLLTLDLEDVFDIQEMGLLSGYESDEEDSDLSDYIEGTIG